LPAISTRRTADQILGELQALSCRNGSKQALAVMTVS
jgi:hypothetical protein